jgi:hypothetical protein
MSLIIAQIITVGIARHKETNMIAKRTIPPIPKPSKNL